MAASAHALGLAGAREARPRPVRVEWPVSRDGFAAGARAMAPGAAVAAALIVAMALGIEPVARLIAVAAVITAIVSPASGLALVALLIPMRDVEAFGPIAFDVTLIVAFGVGMILRTAINPPRVRVPVGAILVIGYCVLGALTLVPSLTGYARDQTASAIALFLGMVAGFALIALAGLLFSRRDARPFLAALLVGGTIACAVGIGAFLIGEGVGAPIRGLLSTEGWDSRAFGPFSNSNYLGFFSAQTFILALGWASLSRGRSRVALLAAAGIAGLALLETFSRGSLIGAAAGILVLALLRSRLLAIVAVSVVVVGGFVLYPLFLGARLDITYGDTSTAAFVAATQSQQYRLDTVMAGIGMFLDQPLFGVGFGMFHFISPRFVGGAPVTYAHDWYVSVLAEQGLVGAIVFGALVVWLAVALFRARHPLRDTALALLAAYAISSFFIDSVPSVSISIIAWLTFAAVLAPRLDLPARLLARRQPRPDESTLQPLAVAQEER